jgi:hypothetical protein
MTSKEVHNFCYADFLLLKHNKVITVNLTFKVYFSTIIIYLIVCVLRLNGTKTRKSESCMASWRWHPCQETIKYGLFSFSYPECVSVYCIFIRYLLPDLKQMQYFLCVCFLLCYINFK